MINILARSQKYLYSLVGIYGLSILFNNTIFKFLFLLCGIVYLLVNYNTELFKLWNFIYPMIKEEEEKIVELTEDELNVYTDVLNTLKKMRYEDMIIYFQEVFTPNEEFFMFVEHVLGDNTLVSSIKRAAGRRHISNKVRSIST